MADKTEYRQSKLPSPVLINFEIFREMLKLKKFPSLDSSDIGDPSQEDFQHGSDVSIGGDDSLSGNQRQLTTSQDSLSC